MAPRPDHTESQSSGDREPDRIVDFERPPVVEVVAAARFVALPTHLALSLGGFWSDVLREDFPTLTEQPPYQAPAERFDKPAPQPEVNLELVSMPDPPRLWATNTDGDELIQLQRNWFACNWRKVAPTAEYGRWQDRRKTFKRRYGEFESWITSHGSTLVPDQCEVTYINHIPTDAVNWSSHADAANVFSTLQTIQYTGPVVAEDLSWRARLLIVDSERAPIGRLHVRAIAAHSREDERPMFVLELTARGQPREPNLAGVLGFLSRGREAVVNTFRNITTDAMRKYWGEHGQV